jgi:putative ABC transport system ATP-binding protein
MSVTLEVTGLCKTYGEGAHAVDAVSDVSFSTTPGEFVAIVGPSGSGKTTLLAMVGALLTPTSGAIAVNGKDIARLTGRQQADYRRRSVGYVFQSNNLVPFLTARENLMLMASISGSIRGEAA